MVTMVGNERDLDDLLRDLIRLDFDAVEAYEAAIARLDSVAYKEALSRFMEDHLRHTRELGLFLVSRGVEAPEGPGAKQILTKGKVVLADLIGDNAVLHAMLSNEGDTNTAYERAASNPAATPDIRQVLQANLGDERRHREWLENAISARKAA